MIVHSPTPKSSEEKMKPWGGNPQITVVSEKEDKEIIFKGYFIAKNDSMLTIAGESGKDKKPLLTFYFNKPNNNGYTYVSHSLNV